MKKPFLSYSTKHHMKRRIIGTDWLFLAAIVALVGAVIGVLWFT